MAEFRQLRELSFERQSKKAGKREQLRVQLMQADNGAKFATLTHFWRADSGQFCPPGKDTLRVTVRRSEAAEVIALLGELLDHGGAPPSEEPERSDVPSKGGADGHRFEAPGDARKTAFWQGARIKCGGQIDPGALFVCDPEARRAVHVRCAEAARPLGIDARLESLVDSGHGGMF